MSCGKVTELDANFIYLKSERDWKDTKKEIYIYKTNYYSISPEDKRLQGSMLLIQEIFIHQFN